MELHHQAEAAVKIAAVIVRRRLSTPSTRTKAWAGSRSLANGWTEMVAAGTEVPEPAQPIATAIKNAENFFPILPSTVKPRGDYHTRFHAGAMASKCKRRGRRRAGGPGERVTAARAVPRDRAGVDLGSSKDRERLPLQSDLGGAGRSHHRGRDVPDHRQIEALFDGTSFRKGPRRPNVQAVEAVGGLPVSHRLRSPRSERHHRETANVTLGGNSPEGQGPLRSPRSRSAENAPAAK